MVKSEEQTKIALSCREAQLLLKVIPINKKTEYMGVEEQEAISHYLNCLNVCNSIGLNEYLSLDISCQEALETCAKNPGPHHLYPPANSIKELLAYEHLWEHPSKRSSLDSYKRVCTKTPCPRFRDYWLNAPLSLFYDGEREIAGEIPFLIKLFNEEKWPMKNLLAIQKGRLDNVLTSIKEKKVLSGYHSVENALYEVKLNIQTLQDLALGSLE